VHLRSQISPIFSTMFTHELLIVALARLFNARGLLRAVLHEPPAPHTPGLSISSLIIWMLMSTTALHPSTSGHFSPLALLPCVVVADLRFDDTSAWDSRQHWL